MSFERFTGKRVSLSAARAIEAIPLRQAVLCLDCEKVTAAKNGHCPSCGGRGLLALERVLNRAEATALKD